MQTASTNIFLSQTDASSVLMETTHYRKIKRPCGTQLKASYIICSRHTALSFVSRGILLHVRRIFYMGERKKENAFPQSSFYFLHRHFKTGQQISWRRGDSEGLTLSHTWVGQGDGRKLHTHTHAYLHTQGAYFKYPSAYGQSKHTCHKWHADHILCTHILAQNPREYELAQIRAGVSRLPPVLTSQHSSLICTVMAHLSSPILYYLHRNTVVV